MIKNEKQLQIAKRELAKFQDAIAEQKAMVKDETDDGDIHALILRGMYSQAQDLGEQILEYSRLVSGQVPMPTFTELPNMGHLLIRSRIICGLTHETFGKLIRVYPQVVQRWEADDYSTVSLGRAKEIALTLIEYHKTKNQASLGATP